jgi:integrase
LGDSMNIKITKAFVEDQNTPGKYKDSELRGFGVRIRGRRKVYIVENNVKGQHNPICVTIGPHNVLSTEQARTEAKRLLALMCQGINPNEQKRQTRQDQAAEKQRTAAIRKARGVTLRSVLDDYLQSRSNLKTNTAYVYKCTLRGSLGDWLDMPISDITKDMIENRHREISNAGKKGAANHVMRILRALLTYASVKYSDENGAPLIQTNPVRRLTEIRAWHYLPRRQSIIKTHQLRGWMAAVNSLDNEVVRDYLLTLLFTGLRKNEAAQLRWCDVDLEERTLKIDDTKNREPHMLPLTNYLYGILANRWQRHEGDYVFPGLRTTTHIDDCRNHVAIVAKESGVPFRLHDLRRTFITIAESLDIPYYAIKRLANHRDGSDVTIGYVIADVERLREPMKKITRFILQHIDAMTNSLASEQAKILKF